MSLNAPLFYVIPEETARIAHAAFPKGNLFMSMRDELGPLFHNQEFGQLYSSTGQPAHDPARLALVTAMQFVDGLSDRQAADAVRDRIAWKYALALPLDDPGFDASVLSEFRTRLMSRGAEWLLFDTLLTVLRDQGLLKARGRQRTDATHVLTAMCVLNRLVLVAETLRHALNELADVAPAWLQLLSPPEWFGRYARRTDDYRLPKGNAERAALATVIGTDGLRVLTAIAAPDAPDAVRIIPAVTILRWVWLQQFYAPEIDSTGTWIMQWRSDTDLPPAGQRIPSPYDVDARYAVKGDMRWVGYKVHVTETCDDDLPHLITHVLTTPGNTHDSHAVEPIHRALQARALVPAEHLLDAGYVDTDLIIASEQTFGVDLIGPVPADHSWQAMAGQGFDLAHFTIDWAAHIVTCPQGQTSSTWQTTHTPRDEPVIHARFATAVCRACPVQAQCVKASGKARDLSLRPQREFEALQHARQRQQTPEWKQQYAARAGIESTIAQGLRRCDLRHARYIGLARTRLQHIFVAVALNLVRWYDWWVDRERPHPPRKPSSFAALAPATV